jgi:glycosyltransferase involved in cell wall biosynthesis
MGEMLSAIVVVYNEAHFLDGCLSRLTFCDEILVVDLGSEDGSRDIAERCGARVIQHDWVPFAEKVRRFALEYVKGNWILFVDPDIYIPMGLGEKLKKLIDQNTEDGLGMVFLPIYTCFGSKPLRFGQKGGRQGYRGVVHRDRVELPDLLHFQGVDLLDKYFALCLMATDEEVIQHFWIDTLQDAFSKGRRYLPYEPEKRLARGQTFSWKRTLAEVGGSLKKDLRRYAFLEWRAVQVMLFQLWYTWMANVSLRRIERT